MTKVDLRIVNARLSNNPTTPLVTIEVRNGEIDAIREAASEGNTAAATIDAAGRLVTPGGVDSHCHVGFQSGEFASKDTYAQTSKAALLGGTTTIIDFAIPENQEKMVDAVNRQQAAGANSFCDFGLHVGVTYWSAAAREELAGLASAGIRTVKMFTTNPGETMVSSETILDVLMACKEFSGLAFIHCEENSIIQAASKMAAAAGRVDAHAQARTRPEVAEVAAVTLQLALAEFADAPIYFVHISTPEALSAISRARAAGVRAYAEALSHHLLLNDGEYDGPNPEYFLCAPPLRPQATVAGLQAALAAGAIDTISSDHCDFDHEQKLRYFDDIRKAPNGLPGAQLRMPVIMSEFVDRDRISLEEFIKMTSETPARLNGLYPRKGALAVGSDADIVIWDEDSEMVVDAGELAMASDFSPFNGWKLTKIPNTVLLRGEVVVSDREFIASEPRGRFLEAEPIDA